MRPLLPEDRSGAGVGEDRGAGGEHGAILLLATAHVRNQAGLHRLRKDRVAPRNAGDGIADLASARVLRYV